MNGVSINENTTLRKIPKIELHAHLSGSMRESTIQELCKEYKIPIPEQLQHITSTSNNNSKNRRSLSECFEIFKSIHRILHTKTILKRVVREALEDFISSGVCYLELRSTPRILDDDSAAEDMKMCKYGYIMTVMETMEQFELQNTGVAHLPNLICRYIVSIDRSKGVEEAWENVKLACEIKNTTSIGKNRIVGIDVSGDPNQGNFDDFVPVLEYARTVGKLFITVHIGEVPCSDTDTSNFDNTIGDAQLKRADDEAISILNFKPDRLGHALFLPNSAWQSLQSSKIPIEICPTSNILTIELASHTHEESIALALQHDKHPILKSLLLQNYPISISTDDPTVFHTNPSRELRLLMSAFPNVVTFKFIVDRLVFGCLDQIFDCEVRCGLEKLIRTKLDASCFDYLN